MGKGRGCTESEDNSGGGATQEIPPGFVFTQQVGNYSGCPLIKNTLPCYVFHNTQDGRTAITKVEDNFVEQGGGALTDLAIWGDDSENPVNKGGNWSEADRFDIIMPYYVPDGDQFTPYMCMHNKSSKRFVFRKVSPEGNDFEEPFMDENWSKNFDVLQFFMHQGDPYMFGWNNETGDINAWKFDGDGRPEDAFGDTWRCKFLAICPYYIRGEAWFLVQRYHGEDGQPELVQCKVCVDEPGKLWSDENLVGDPVGGQGDRDTVPGECTHIISWEYKKRPLFFAYNNHTGQADVFTIKKNMKSKKYMSQSMGSASKFEVMSPLYCKKTPLFVAHNPGDKFYAFVEVGKHGFKPILEENWRYASEKLSAFQHPEEYDDWEDDEDYDDSD